MLTEPDGDREIRKLGMEDWGLGFIWALMSGRCTIENDLMVSEAVVRVTLYAQCQSGTVFSGDFWLDSRIEIAGKQRMQTLPGVRKEADD